MRQRCGPIRRVSIEDGYTLDRANETTHAAPELVNRSSIYTLRRPCDLHHGHDKTSHSGPTTMQHCPDNSAEAKTKSCKHESAPENVIATQQKILSRVSVNTSTHPKNLAQRSICVVLLHRVATHTAKDHQRQHVMGTAQDADTETNVRGHRELRQYTWRTDAREHQSSASNPRRKKRTHMKFALSTMCEHNTRPTWHMTPPQTNQLCFASRCVTSRYSTTPYLAHRPCLSNDDVSERHDTNHDRCMTACRVFSQLA